MLGSLYTLIAVPGILFRSSLASLMGAGGEAHRLLCEYILGYFPALPLQALTALMMSFVGFNNDMRRSYLAAGVMSLGNLLGDLLLVGCGTLGIGLATTFSYAAGFLILLPGYLNKEKAVHLEMAVPELPLVGKALMRGLPTLLFTIGMVVKNTLMNRALLQAVGDPGIAVANVLFSVCDIAGILIGGCASAYSTLAGICYGEEDRQSFRALFAVAVRIGVTGCLGIMALIMAFSSLMTNLFFPPDFPALEAARSMFLLGFTFLPLSCMMNLLMSTWQAQGKMKLVNVLSVGEVSLIGVLAFVFVPVFGTNAAWLSNALVDLICLGVILAAAWILKGSAPFDVNALMRLSANFGAAPEELQEYTLRSRKQVCSVSESAIAFCEQKGIDGRTAAFAGLCIEEMANNIFEHGGHQEEKVFVDIRMVAREELTIRIRDNCIAFDPRKRLDQFDPARPARNMGIRLTAGLARQMDYYNNAGVNTLIMKL